MDRIDTIAAFTRLLAIMTLGLIGLMLLCECQHDALVEQRQIIERQTKVMARQDSLIDRLCKDCDSLQILAGVDND